MLRHPLAIERHVAPGRVEVALADVEGVHAQAGGDVVQHGFDAEHALWPAEAPERRVGHGVGLAAMPGDLRMGQIVGVGRVQHGAIDDALGEVGGVAALAGKRYPSGHQAPFGIVAHVVLAGEVVPLAGLRHVVLAWQAALHRHAQAPREEGGDAGHRRRLALLAAEGATHAPTRHPHFVHRGAQHLGHQRLNLGGMLGGRLHVHRAAFFRDGERHLAFEIEVFLAAHIERALQPPRGSGEPLRRIPFAPSAARQHEAPLVERGGDIQHRRRLTVIHLREARGPTRRGQGAGGDGEQRLADELHRGGEQRVARIHGADVEFARHVVRGHHIHHARGGTRGGEIKARHVAVRDGGGAHGDMQGARWRRQIIHIPRRAGDMPQRRIVAQRRSDGRHAAHASVPAKVCA